MNHDRLLGRSDKGGITEAQQATFDLQCFKEFVRSIDGLGYRAHEADKIDDGRTPWDMIEDDIHMAYHIRGRRVDKFNLMSIAIGRQRGALVEAFGDLTELDDRPTVMIFKYGGDKAQGIPGTKMVYAEHEAVSNWFAGDLCAGILVAASEDIPSGVILTYKNWRELFSNGYEVE